MEPFQFMTASLSQEVRRISSEGKTVIFMEHLIAFRMVIVISVHSTSYNTQTLSLSVWTRNLERLIKRTHIVFETSEAHPNVKIVCDGKYFAFFNQARGYISVFEFPKFSQPLFTFPAIENLRSVVLSGKQRRLFAVSKEKEIVCYRLDRGDLDYTRSIQSKQKIESIYLIKEQNTLVANTVNEVFTIDAKNGRILTNFETHKLPVIGRSSYDVVDVLGFASKTNKIILRGIEFNENTRGQIEQEEIIEICNLTNLRKDMRFTLGSDVGFSFASRRGQEVIWSLKNGIYYLDLKSKEITNVRVLNNNELIVAGAVNCKMETGNALKSLLIATSEYIRLVKYRIM